MKPGVYVPGVTSVSPSDALAQLGGIAYMVGDADQRDQARRMISLLIDALTLH